MRAVIKRVSSAKVEINGEVVGKIGKGLLVLLGVEDGDTLDDIEYMCHKISGIRIFEDSEGKMNLDLHDVSGEVLVVSQFTLLGDNRKGRRPSFINAARPEIADEYYQRVCEGLSALELHVERGVFMAYMNVSLVNDGPVTILLDSRRIF